MPSPPDLIPTYPGDPPYLTSEQMREVDRAMIEDYGVALLQMMENAGRALALVARSRFLQGDLRGKRVLVMAGKGGNGGGALVGARRLHGWGADVAVLVTGPDEDFTPVAGHQLATVRRLGIEVEAAGEEIASRPLELIIDGVIGYGLEGAPRGSAATLIAWANRHGAPILALDAPSGIDTTSGAVYHPAIRAAATVTLALPKTGLAAPPANAHVGDLYLADIGVPPSLYAAPALGIEVGALFARSDVVRLA